MTNEEHNQLKDNFLILPEHERNCVEYRRLETQMAACFDARLGRYHSAVAPIRHRSNYKQPYRRLLVTLCDGQR